MTAVGVGAGLGHIGLVARLKNRSGTGCILDGYPGIRLIGRDGALLRTVVTHANAGDYLFPGIASHRIALPPGAFAAFDLGYEDNPGGPAADLPYDVACPPASKIRVTLPVTGEYGTASIELAPCEGVVNVSPIFLGSEWIGYQ